VQKIVTRCPSGSDVGVGAGQADDQAFGSELAKAMARGAPNCRAEAPTIAAGLVAGPAHRLPWQGDQPGKHRPNAPLTSVDALCHHEDLLICDFDKRFLPDCFE
jgi:hypothetical protein